MSFFFLFFLFGCNPERVEKLGQSLETTANVLDAFTPSHCGVVQQVEFTS